MSSSFLGDENNFLPTSFYIPEDESEKDVKIREYLGNIATATNSKDSGTYDSLETITGQQFLPTFGTQTEANATFRDVFRKVIDFGALTNTSAKSVAHGIPIGTAQNVTYSATKIYAAATNPGVAWIPIPYASPTLANSIELSLDATNVIITTGNNRTAFTRCFVIIEYIKTT